MKKQVKVSHRIIRISFYETKSAENQVEMAHRTALWDKTYGKASQSVP